MQRTGLHFCYRKAYLKVQQWISIVKGLINQTHLDRVEENQNPREIQKMLGTGDMCFGTYITVICFCH